MSAQITAAASGAETFRRLLHQGLKLYKRGSSVGVEDVANGRRYRLKTLGLGDAFELARGQWRDMIAKLPSPNRKRGRSRSRDLGMDR